MIKQLCIAMLFLITSCIEPNATVENADSIVKAHENVQGNRRLSADTTVKFLWMGNRYDTIVKDSVNAIFINEAYLQKISEPERAAIGYVATFIGNECNWDGTYKADRSNLKCKILSALNLGYQCSDKHLGFLRQWFKNDDKVLGELDPANCPTIPDGSTIQKSFEEIILTKKENAISVSFKVKVINVRAGKTSTWAETDLFELNGDNIKLIDKNKSSIKQDSSASANPKS